ncbi:hypothetical protein ACFV6G_26580 [Streptomyces lavendulae]|uniref:hypothetical protein n=1 Tax=Streptomyces lavendulae TaxID=1914 RepID=UPI0036937CC0
MNDPDEELLTRVRTVLSDAGFEEIATGAEGVHLIRRARGVMVGWMPTQITRPATRRRGPRRTRPAPADLPGLRHAFTLAFALALALALALAATLRAAGLRAAGLTVETRDDQWLLVLDTHHTPH